MVPNIQEKEMIKEIRYFFRKIKWIFQKIFRGYNDVDLWNLNYHLAELILKRLKAFRKMDKNGVPAEFAPKHHEGEIDMAAWNEALDKMIWSFQHVLYDYGSEEDCPYKDDIWHKCEPYPAFPFFDPDFKLDVKFSMADHEEYHARYEDGMKLFAKYFSNLGD